MKQDLIKNRARRQDDRVGGEGCGELFHISELTMGSDNIDGCFYCQDCLDKMYNYLENEVA